MPFPRSLKITLCLFPSALALHAGLILPPSEWGDGGSNVVLNISYPYGTLPSGVGSCYAGLGDGPLAMSCSAAQTSSLGSGSGFASGYTDVNGIHVYANLSAAGANNNQAEGFGSFTDTLTNNTSQTLNFQLSYEVDAALSASGSGSAPFLWVDFWHGYANSTVQNHAVGIQNTEFKTPGTIDQILTSPLITLAPGVSYMYSLSMDAAVYTYNSGSATSDASDTLTITQFTVTDSYGNVVPTSSLTSSNGVDYTDFSTAPEPGTLGLCILAGAALIRRTRR